MESKAETLKIQVSHSSSAELTEKIALMLVYSKEWIVEFTTATSDGRDMENSLSDWRDSLLRDRKNSISIKRTGSSQDIKITILFFGPLDSTAEISISSDSIESNEFDYAVRSIKGCIAFLLEDKNKKTVSEIIEKARPEYWQSFSDLTNEFINSSNEEFDGLKIERLHKDHYAYLVYAMVNVSEVIPDIERIQSEYWDKIQPFPEYFGDIYDAEENINLALALDLEPLDAARAYFMLLSIWLTKEEEVEFLLDDNDVSDTPDLMSFARNIISLTKRYLIEDVQSLNALFALRLQKAALLFLNEREDIGEIEEAMAQLKKIIKAGLVGTEKVNAKTHVKVSKINDGKALEGRVKELLHSMGLKASTTKTTGDGGIDIIAYSDSPIFSGKYVVQCKDWSGSVGESVIRDLYGVMTAESANKGILITTGAITKSAYKFAEGKPLELINGEQLSKLLHKFKPS